MSKHTPGPWTAKVIDTIYGEPAYWHIVQTGKNGVIGDVQSANFADARLIAAAPDLVSQLQQCVRYLADLNGSQWIKGTDAGSIDMRQRAIALQKMAFSAIAKATEGQP